jgi:hypothetical protein
MCKSFFDLRLYGRFQKSVRFSSNGKLEGIFTGHCNSFILFVHKMLFLAIYALRYDVNELGDTGRQSAPGQRARHAMQANHGQLKHQLIQCFISLNSKPGGKTHINETEMFRLRLNAIFLFPTLALTFSTSQTSTILLLHFTLGQQVDWVIQCSAGNRPPVLLLRSRKFHDSKLNLE